jgi:hypothetical protein
MLMRPISDVREAMALVDNFSGPPDAFVLCLAESLHDAIGVNIALIADRILAKGWEPNGVERFDRFRVYRYKVMR